MNSTALQGSSYRLTFYLKQAGSSAEYGGHIHRGKEATRSLAGQVLRGVSKGGSGGENIVVACTVGQEGGTPKRGPQQEESPGPPHGNGDKNVAAGRSRTPER